MKRGWWNFAFAFAAEAEGPRIFCNEYACAHDSESLHRSIVFSEI